MSALDPSAVLGPVPRSMERAGGAVVHRNVDGWLIGGLSLLTFGVMYLGADKAEVASQVSWAAFYLAFLVNGPHFFASYWHLYVDGRHRLRSDPRYVWAAWVVPTLLLAGLVAGARVSSPALLGRMVQLMYLSVGWHYVKQTFGVALVSSAAHGRPVSGLSKRALRINMLTVWLLSFVTTNDYAGGNQFFGVAYKSWDLPDWTRPTAYVLVGITAAVALYAQLLEWIRTGRAMALPAWAAIAAIYVWYLPVMAHAGYFYLIPFFHSLQYLMFSATLTWNKSRSLADRDGDTRLGQPDERLAFARRIGVFIVATFVLGAAGFHWLPEWLDRNHTVRPDVLGTAYWVVAFNLFINVHHYFVDNVIWRGTNPDVRAYLGARPAPPTTAPESAGALESMSGDRI